MTIIRNATGGDIGIGTKKLAAGATTTAKAAGVTMTDGRFDYALLEAWRKAGAITVHDVSEALVAIDDIAPRRASPLMSKADTKAIQSALVAAGVIKIAARG